MNIFASLYVRTYVYESAYIHVLYMLTQKQVILNMLVPVLFCVSLMFIDIVSNVRSYEMRIILQIKVNSVI